jgi:plasmid stabilization system protein ParE
MVYKIFISIRAQREIENAIDYYNLYSLDAPTNFINSLKEAFEYLTTNPFYVVKYKNVRSLKISKFPYSLYFVIDKESSTVKIIACFHSKRNPVYRPKG